MSGSTQTAGGTDRTWSVDDALAAFRSSQSRLTQVLTPLTPEQLEADSYDNEWTIAQVASHLGSGAEIFGGIVGAVSRGAATPGPESFQPIWQAWNAKPAVDQARNALEANARFISTVAELTPDQRERWEIDLFGMHLRLPDLLAMRLGEHVLHTWDIAVMFDPAATLPDDATPVVLDGVGRIVARTGKTDQRLPTVQVITTNPDRAFDLALDGETAELRPAVHAAAADPAGATLQSPAEAFVRLVYGRLDARHTPQAVQTGGVDLDALRRTFPGP